MTAEATIHAALSALVAGRVYPDVAPSGAALPRIVYQQVGGQALVYLENTLADKEHGRFQIACWAMNRLAAITLMKQAEDALMAAPAITCTPIGARNSIYEDDTQRYGCRQDFSVWSTR